MSCSSSNSSSVLVHIAENGRTFEVDCDETTPVEAVMRFIESVSHINMNDQLVLCLDMKLDPHRPLSAYKLPSHDDLFIFNKARLQPNSPPPPLEHLDHHSFDAADPPQPSSHALDDAADPALPSYEREFRVHYHKGHVIYSRTQLKYDNCERLLREHKVQQRAVEVAKGNLDHYYRMINQYYAEFMKRYAHQCRIHSDILANLGRDLDKLRSIKLHPALQNVNRKCLSDFVKDETVRNDGETCTHSHKQFENKVSQFNKMLSEVKQKVEELFVSTASLPIKNLELTIKEHHRYLNEQKSIMQSLSFQWSATALLKEIPTVDSKDVNTVKKLVDDCLSSQLSSSLRPHDAVSALGPMYDVHDKNHLPRMQACENAISKLLDYCMDKKNEMNMFIHSYMQKITYISYIIKDAKLQFPVFKEAMVRQDDLFYELKLVRGIGPAYRACLAEIVRRKASLKLYMGMAGQLAERLATKREAEVRRREEFLKVHSSYIPRDVLASMGLYDTPNQCDVNIAPFDTGLLDIDISDLDRYAPEYLAGLSSKGSFRGSSSMSNESSHSAEVDELTVDNIEKCDPEELLEGCELVEIAGTSKMEVENAKLKAELASAIAVICSFWPEADFESLDESKTDNLLKDAAAKTAEALHLKDEYAKRLKSMLSTKQLQCLSYEKRIQELEQKLSDQYMQGQKLTHDKDGSDGGALTARLSNTEPMDEVSCISNSLDAKLGLFNERGDKIGDGADENMMDSSAVHNHQLDSSMQEIGREELLGRGKDGKEKMVGQLGTSLAHSSTAESKPELLIVSRSETTLDPCFGTKVSTELLSELETLLKNKSNQLSETEIKLNAAMEDAAMLKRELDTNLKLLDESQDEKPNRAPRLRGVQEVGEGKRNQMRQSMPPDSAGNSWNPRVILA